MGYDWTLDFLTFIVRSGEQNNRYVGCRLDSFRYFSIPHFGAHCIGKTSKETFIGFLPNRGELANLMIQQ